MLKFDHFFQNCNSNLWTRSLAYTIDILLRMKRKIDSPTEGNGNSGMLSSAKHVDSQNLVGKASVVKSEDTDEVMMADGKVSSKKNQISRSLSSRGNVHRRSGGTAAGKVKKLKPSGDEGQGKAQSGERNDDNDARYTHTSLLSSYFICI